jgi:hypothetical protein
MDCPQISAAAQPLHALSISTTLLCSKYACIYTMHFMLRRECHLTLCGCMPVCGVCCAGLGGIRLSCLIVSACRRAMFPAAAMVGCLCCSVSSQVGGSQSMVSRSDVFCWLGGTLSLCYIPGILPCVLTFHSPILARQCSLHMANPCSSVLKCVV